jgi:DnaK suppressor protein
MKKKELACFRKILAQQLEELTQKSDNAVARLLNSTIHCADPLDRTTQELERDLALHMLDRENKLMLKIKKALQKIEDQSFGICEVCGEPIDIERLKLRPVTEFCIGCKTHQERLEKLSCT